MEVQLKTRYASPLGTHAPGSVITVGEIEGEQLVAAGCAVVVRLQEVEDLATGAQGHGEEGTEGTEGTKEAKAAGGAGKKGRSR
jgi:hypothetical protein